MIDEPTPIVADGGVTVTSWTPALLGGATVTLSPQAAVSVPNARTPASSSERENLCILPPKEWCVMNCERLSDVAGSYWVGLVLRNYSAPRSCAVRRGL